MKGRVTRTWVSCLLVGFFTKWLHSHFHRKGLREETHKSLLLASKTSSAEPWRECVFRRQADLGSKTNLTSSVLTANHLLFLGMWKSHVGCTEAPLAIMYGL